MEYSELYKDYDELIRIMGNIHEKKLFTNPIKIEDILKPKYFLLTNVMNENPEDYVKMQITFNKENNIIISPMYKENIKHDASKYVFTQVIVKFKGDNRYQF